MIIAIDFDGTCVRHEFPNVGKNIGAAPVLRKLVDNGHKLILFTMRSNKKEGTIAPDALEFKDEHKILFETDVLNDAINWFVENNIPLYGINTNPNQKRWTNSPKVHANLYIDDCSLGIPLKPDGLRNKCVDWKEVEVLLKSMKLI